MATEHHTLIDSLSALDRGTNSAFEKFTLCNKACDQVKASELSDTDKQHVVSVMEKASNPSGWCEVSTGIRAGIEALRALAEAAEEASSTTEAVKAPTLNLTNFTALVQDGTIFSVEFIKRTTGERRKMLCRTGVKKHLKGGDKAYNAASKGLLTVYDLQAKGYRSIPVDAVVSLSVHGQQFQLGAVA